MVIASEHKDALKAILDPEEIIPPSAGRYRAESLPWAAQKYLQPAVVLRPASVKSLSKTLAYLSPNGLSFAVRSQGVGSASAKDVLISLSAFDGVEFDRTNEVVTVGAGQSWGDYYAKMDKIAPGYATVSVRTPFVGVGGSVLGGGYSWLSSEYGLTSDPANFLDAEVVTVDGRVLWASQDPELLFSLRGAYGFAVVTRFKLRARKYQHEIWGGNILIPTTELHSVVDGVMAMNSRAPNPKVGFYLFMMRKERLSFIGAKEDMLMIQAFDALGKEHGRSEAGFKWALDCPGAIDATKILSLSGMAKLQDVVGKAKGTANIWCGAIPLERIDAATIIRAFEWYGKAAASPGTVGKNAALLFEFFTTRDSLTSNTDSAWPRPQGFQHKVTISAGTDIGASKDEINLARKLVSGGPNQIVKTPGVIQIVPNAMEDFHDPVTQVYRQNYPRLQAVKRKYDPGNKLGGPIRPTVG